MPTRHESRVGVLAALHVAEVGPGAEGSAGAGEDHHRYLRRRPGTIEGVGQCVVVGLVEGVEGFGSVNPEEADSVGIIDVEHDLSVAAVDPQGDAGPMDNVRCLLTDDPAPDAEALASRPGVLAVDLVDQDRLHLLRARSMPVARPIWTALIWITGETHFLTTEHLLGVLEVDRHRVWGASLGDRGDAALSPDALLMVSLVARRGDLDDDTFVERYRSHAEVARTHHGFGAYRQNVVRKHVALQNVAGCDAISEILLATEEDWRNNFYATPSSAETVGRDVARFLDRAGTSSTLVRRFPGTA